MKSLNLRTAWLAIILPAVFCGAGEATVSGLLTVRAFTGR